MGPEGTLVATLRRAATHHGARVAVRDDVAELTHASLARAADDAAARLVARGVRRGHRVAVVAPNSVDWVVAAFGALVAGATLAPVHHGLAPQQRDAALARVRPALVLTADDLPGVTTGPVPGRGCPTPPAAEDVALVLTTSGTTGPATSVPMTHGQLSRLYGDVSATLRLTPDDLLLGVVPLAHSFGFNGVLLVAMAAGAGVRLVTRHDPPDTAALVRGERVTVVAGPPTVLHDLYAEYGGRPLEGCRLAVTGGTEVHARRLAEVCRALGIPRAVVGYGLTEACGTVGLGALDPAGESAEEQVPVWPVPGVEVRISRSGRVQTRGYQVAVGASRLEDGWLDTGDLGRLTDAGLVVEGRGDDAVVVRGFNVAPSQVEEAIANHPAVRAVAVVGVADDRSGQQLVACVVPGDGEVVIGPDLVTWARERLAAYQVPGRVVVLDRLPTTLTGKVSRARLRELVAADGGP